MRSVQNSSLRLMGLIAMPCAVGLIVLAEPIVALLGGYTGANLTLATRLMAILGVAVVFNSIVLMTDAIMQAHNHAVIPVINTLIGGVIKVIVNYILVGNPDIAITGAPVGTIACYAVITVLNLIAMRRVLRRNAPKLLPNLWKTTIADRTRLRPRAAEAPRRPCLLRNRRLRARPHRHGPCRRLPRLHRCGCPRVRRAHHCAQGFDL